MSKTSTLQLPWGYPEILGHIASIIFAELTRDGMLEADAEALSIRVAESVRKVFGGIQHYIPRAIDVDLASRNKAIYADFTGDNYPELAQKYRLSEMQIRNIVRQGIRISRKA